VASYFQKDLHYFVHQCLHPRYKLLSQYLFPCDFVKGLIDMDELLSFRNEIAWVLESRLWSFNEIIVRMRL